MVLFIKLKPMKMTFSEYYVIEKREKFKKIVSLCYLAESFYHVKYGSSIITSKVNKIISVMKT